MGPRSVTLRAATGVSAAPSSKRSQSRLNPRLGMCRTPSPDERRFLARVDPLLSETLVANRPAAVPQPHPGVVDGLRERAAAQASSLGPPGVHSPRRRRITPQRQLGPLSHTLPNQPLFIHPDDLGRPFSDVRSFVNAGSQPLAICVYSGRSGDVKHPMPAPLDFV